MADDRASGASEPASNDQQKMSLQEVLTDLASAPGTAEEVVEAKKAEDGSDPYSQALKGKQIGVFWGADLEELSGDQPLQANADRMIRILELFGAKVERAPLSEETGNTVKRGGLDATVFFIHDFGGRAPLEGGPGAKGDGWLTAGEVSSWPQGLVKNGGVALWVGCDTAEGRYNFVDASFFNVFGYTGGTVGDVYYEAVKYAHYSTTTQARWALGKSVVRYSIGRGTFPENPWVWSGPVPWGP